VASTCRNERSGRRGRKGALKKWLATRAALQQCREDISRAMTILRSDSCSDRFY
jgi:hypothetical protein